jgi:hypothetical protein
VDHRSAVVYDVRCRLARRQLDLLLAEAGRELAAAAAGDLEAVYGAHRALSRAVTLLLTYRWDAA